MPKGKKKNDELKQIIEAGQRLGVTIDEKAAKKWLSDLKAAEKTKGDVVIDEKTGIYGHEITMIDFDAKDLERYKNIGDIVGLPDTPGVVETALSLSGSAAQGKVQRFPGDLDFFERVNIIAPTKEEACNIIGDVMRKKALSKFYSPTYQLIEVKWGTFLTNVFKNEKLLKTNSPISWAADEVKQGYMMAKDENGKAIKIDWDYGKKNPGWCKLDWIIAEPAKGIINVSNMLDVTWEAPNGEIIPLDGQLDSYYQEVYIEKESIPLFTKLKKYLTPDKLDAYVDALKGEVRKYTEEGHENYGKVAKRLYNIFRLIGAHKEAMFIRELFDEPASALYQVWSLIDTIDEISKSATAIDKKTVTKQITDLIKLVVKVTEGEEEEKIVDALLKLRDDITGVADISDQEWDKLVSESRFIIIKLVNEYFFGRLKAIPEIGEYLGQIQKEISK